MSTQPLRFRSARTIAATVASLAIAAAACFTPRPYAIIVVSPPATASSSSQSAASVPAEPKAYVVPVEPRMKNSVPEALQDYLKASQTEPKRANALSNEAEMRTVAPSARVRALDAAENVRMRNVVAQNFPRALADFPRADSGLLMLYDDNNKIVKQTPISLSVTRPGADPIRVFSATFSVLDIYTMESASEFTIDRSANDATLSTPLRLFTAHLITAGSLPMTRAEATPSRETMLATVRSRHPLSVADTVANSNVSVLLYDTKGTLLQSALVTVENNPVNADGSINHDYDRVVWRKAFGAVMDSGTIIQNGTLSFLTGNSIRTGPAKIMYAMMVKEDEMLGMMAGSVQGKPRNWTFGGSSSRKGTVYSSNSDEFYTRLHALVQTRVPDAYGDWSRADSAVVFLFDANNELIARKTAYVPSVRSLLPLANYISLRVLTYSADDIDHVGWTNHLSSSSGRVLDKPLVVIWGRLSPEATRKRELGLQSANSKE